MKFTSASILAVTLLKSFASAKLSGSYSITPNDYIGLPPQGLLNNPPACEMPYATLDLGRIVAVQALDKSTDCNKCLKIVNEQGDYVYALAVDLGGQGLDLSTPSFKALFGQQYDATPATWSETAYSNCKGIYDPKGHPTVVAPKKISGSSGGNGGSPTKPTPTKSISKPTKRPTQTPSKSNGQKKKKNDNKKQTKPKDSKKKKTSKNKKTTKHKAIKKVTKPNTKKCTRCKVHHQPHHRHVRYAHYI
ncbi:unnamed protein product [Cunninghamella blakesleeana]